MARLRTLPEAPPPLPGSNQMEQIEDGNIEMSGSFPRCSGTSSRTGRCIEERLVLRGLPSIHKLV